VSAAARPSGPRRVAVVHDWLVTYAGSERVLEQILLVFPDADLFAVVDFVPDADRAFLGGRRPRTTFVQRLPLARSRHRGYLPLMPLAVEQLDLTGYDLVVSSSHAVAKGVIAGPDALHVCYCHSPLRYAWDLQPAYLRDAGLGWGPRGLAARALLHRLRQWDATSANRVDHFVANSAFIARRIAKAYRRDAEVVYPPVDTEAFAPGPPAPGARARGEYYVTSSRFVPYKRVPMIVEAFRGLPGRRLVVVGDGPERAAVRRAAGPNVELAGHLPRGELLALLRGARAYLFAAVEDFGIAPVEAQACGTPVVAYRGGALPETVPGLDAPEPCGVLYDAQTPEGLRAGIAAFEGAGRRIRPDACRRNAERFGAERFRREFAALVARRWAECDASRRALPRAGTPAAPAG
jgi:glycosyltransferase involved in cell wall biosynthesis